jgi:endonuclease G
MNMFLAFVFMVAQAAAPAPEKPVEAVKAVDAQLEVTAFEPSPPLVQSKHWVYGMPQGTPSSNVLIIRDIYALSSNDKTKFADWVAYRLTPYEVIGTLDLERKWRADPWLQKEETLEPNRPDDYKGANAKPFEYDRGHQAPLAAFKGSRYASQANYFSNITPQKKELNQGPWRILEAKVRALVKKGNTLWIMTGPLYRREREFGGIGY